MKTSMLSALCVYLLAAASTVAQIIPPARVGVSAGLTINSISPSIAVWRPTDSLSGALAQFRTLDPDAKYSSSGTGIGGAFAIAGGIPLTSTLHLSGSIGYHSLPTSITSERQIPTATATHTLSLFSSMLQIAPSLEFYGLFGGLSLHPIIGLDIGIPLSTSESRITTINEQNTFSEQLIAQDAPIENASTRTALLLGVGYTFKIDSNVFVQPHITYSHPLTNISSSALFSPTSIAQLRIGIAVYLGFTSAQPLLDTRKPLTGSMDKITGIDNENREMLVSSISVEDVRYNEMFPLVPYIFCNQGGLPDETQQNANYNMISGNFTIESLPLDALEVNKNLLNIVALRMKKYPQAALTITGTTDGKKEATDKSLAMSRAEWAKTYLTEQCGIEQARILVKATTVPTRPSAINDPDGIVENRRIELSSNVPDVLSPVMLTADNQRVANYDVIVFYPSVSDSSIQSWTMNVTQAGRSLRTLNGNGRPQPIRWAMRANELSAAQVPVDYDLILRRSPDDSVVVAGSIPVDYISSVRKKTENLPDKSIDKYSLILFDFDKATLGEENQRILEQMVLPSISAISKVSIVGYSDRIGNDDYNMKLSRERAESVRAFLQVRARDARFYTMGVGESTEVFPNAMPVGRQLSRTVQVIVETPRR
jgi:outer membrane protein OmpA-like peptidoglycan-associated protein